MTLDDRIYCLQRTNRLHPRLKVKLMHADLLYMQDKDDEAEASVAEIERECIASGIKIYQPAMYDSFMPSQNKTMKEVVSC